MLKGLAITPPVIGRISIGRVVERNGKRLPEKDDQFTLTSQIQNRDGWVLHPLDEALRKEGGEKSKLRAIPVRVLFNDPALNLRADYSLFDRTTGRPVCVGNGDTSRRVGPEGVSVQPCVGPDSCAFACGDCKAYARLNVVIGEAEEDALGSFVLRTTSFNDPDGRGAAPVLQRRVGRPSGLPAAGAEAAGQEHDDEPQGGHLLRRSGGASRSDAGTGHRPGTGAGRSQEGLRLRSGRTGRGGPSGVFERSL